MFRLKVKQKSRWRLGIVVYDKYEDAIARVNELKDKGIQSKIVSFTGESL